jgi:hypothetical protein
MTTTDSRIVRQVYAANPYTTPGSNIFRPAELLLYTRSTDPNHPDLKLIATISPPNTETMLTITAVHGAVLSIQGASGTTYHFDVINRALQ